MASHRRNAAIARSYVDTQLTKAWFIAKAQQIAVWASAAMMSIGLSLWYTGIKLTFSVDTVKALVAASPVIIVIIVFACFVEGMVITASSGRLEVREKVNQELEVLKRAKSKHPDAYTEEEYEQEKKRIKAQMWGPDAIMLLFCSFSFVGGELFWMKMLQDSHDIVIHICGYVLGSAICVGLIYLETHQDLIERKIDRSISSTHLIYRAMDMDAKGEALDDLARERSRQLKTPEFKKIIIEAAETSLYAPLAESLRAMGSTVSDQQLMYQVRGKIAARSAANQLVAGLEQADRDTDEIPVQRERGNYNTAQQKRCREVILKYGHGLVSSDPEKFAKEAKVARATLIKALDKVG